MSLFRFWRQKDRPDFRWLLSPAPDLGALLRRAAMQAQGMGRGYLVPADVVMAVLDDDGPIVTGLSIGTAARDTLKRRIYSAAESMVAVPTTEPVGQLRFSSRTVRFLAVARDRASELGSSERQLHAGVLVAALESLPALSEALQAAGITTARIQHAAGVS